jgi:hypothetical protein
MFKETFKSLAKSKKINRCDMALLCLVRATEKEDPLVHAKVLLKKAFTPVMNKKKLENGAHPYASLWIALTGIVGEYGYYGVPSKDLLAEFKDEEGVPKLISIRQLAASMIERYNFGQAKL